MNTLLYIVLGVIVLIVLWIIGVFNSLIRLRHRTNEAWSDIDVQLKRRYNLIPNLVETVKGYAKHEKGVFQKVTEARSKAMSAKGVEEKGKAENMLSNTLKTLFAVAENYPDLKANQNFLGLQDELTNTENKIAYSRQHFNDSVLAFNNTIETFPGLWFAKRMGRKTREMLKIPEAAREVPKVKF